MKIFRSAVVATMLTALSMGAAHASVFAVEQSAFTGATVINFDNLAANTSITTQYAAQGVADFNATVLGAQGFATTYSGISYSGMGAILGASIKLNTPVDRVGAWIYKNNGQQYLTALDANQNVLMTVAENAGSNDSAAFDFVGIESTLADIMYVVISNKDLSVNPNWNIGGATTFFDNFTFGGTNAVPEPGSIALLAIGLLGFGAFRKRKQQ